MKIYEIINEAHGKWIKAPSGKGVLIINPKWEEENLQKMWLQKERKPASGLNRSEAMKKRHADFQRKLDNLFMYIEHAIGNSIPDGDPIDSIAPYVRRHFDISYENPWGDITKLLDKACRKAGYKSYNDLLYWNWESYYDSNEEQSEPAMDLFSLTANPENLVAYDQREDIKKRQQEENPAPERPENPWGRPS